MSKLQPEEYEIKTEHGRYGNKWIVLRLRDGKVMTEGNVKHCLKWVKMWGDVDLGR